MLVLKVEDNGKSRLIKFHEEATQIEEGGTGALTPEEARYNLGLASTALATSLTAGLMSPEDKQKLDRLSDEPTNIPLATPQTDGLMSAQDKEKLDGLSNNVATQSSDGLMSAQDKIKLDNLSQAGANFDYDQALNKPSIEGVELKGNVPLVDLGVDIASSDDVDDIFVS